MPLPAPGASAKLGGSFVEATAGSKNASFAGSSNPFENMKLSSSKTFVPSSIKNPATIPVTV